MHESRHLHALKRNRGKYGRFESNMSQDGDNSDALSTITSSSSFATPTNNAVLSHVTPTFPIRPSPIMPSGSNNLSAPTTSTGSNYNMSALDEFRKVFGTSISNKDVEEALRGMVQSGLVDLQHCATEDIGCGISTGAASIGNNEQ